MVISDFFSWIDNIVFDDGWMESRKILIYKKYKYLEHKYWGEPVWEDWIMSYPYKELEGNINGNN